MITSFVIIALYKNYTVHSFLLQPFQAREGGDDADEAAQPGDPVGSRILEHQCSEASDCSDKGGNDQARLLVGTQLTDIKTSRVDSCEGQVCDLTPGKLLL